MFLVALTACAHVAAAAGMAEEEKKAILEEHNLLRHVHTPVPLKWDAEIALDAQAWADAGILEPSDTAIGENLAWAQAETLDGREVTRAWFAEEAPPAAASVPSYRLQGLSALIGLPMQAVRNTSRRLGCGRSTMASRDFWVCRYAPAAVPGAEFGEGTERASNPARAAGSAAAAAAVPARRLVADEESLSYFLWAFGVEPACKESGFIILQGFQPSGVYINYNVTGFAVKRSGAGLPTGSTEDGSYSFKPVMDNRHPTVMKVHVQSGSCSFSGRFSNSEGDLVVLTTEAEDHKAVSLGSGRGKILGTDCVADLRLHKMPGPPPSKFAVTDALVGARGEQPGVVAALLASASLVVGAVALLLLARRRRRHAAAGGAQQTAE